MLIGNQRLIGTFKLALCLTLSIFLSACGKDSKDRTQTWNIEPEEGTPSRFEIPQDVLQKTDINDGGSMRAEIQVDNGSWQPMTIDADDAQVTLVGLQVGTRTIRIRFTYESTEFGSVEVATSVKTVAIKKGERTQLELTEADYSYPDTNKDGVSDLDALAQGIRPNNALPVIGLQAATAANEGDNFSLDASTTSDDVEGNLRFFWQQTGEAPAVVITDPTAAVTNLQVPQLRQDYDLTFKLTVTDGEQGQTSKDVTIKISANDDAPKAHAGEKQIVTPGQRVTLDASSSDAVEADDSIASYQWRQIVDENNPPATIVTLSAGDSAKPTFDLDASALNETLLFEVTVIDLNGNTDSATVEVEINTTNMPPVAAVIESTIVADELALVTLDASPSSDIETQFENLLFHWAQKADEQPQVTFVEDSNIPPAHKGPSISFNAPNLPANQTLNFTLVVEDEGNKRSEPIDITVEIQADNDKPVAVVAPGFEVSLGQTVELNGTGSSDPEGQAISFQWAQTTDVAIGELTDAASDRPSFTVPDGLADGEQITFELVVSDPEMLSSEPAVTTFTVKSGLTPLIAKVDASTAQAEEGDTVFLSGEGSSGNGDLTYEWFPSANNAVQVTFDSPTNRKDVSFTAPELLAPVILSFDLRVTDATNRESPRITHNVSINADNDPPIANAGSDRDVKPGMEVSLDGSSSTDPESQTLSYLWREETAHGVTLLNLNTATPSFTVPEGLMDGQVLIFEVEVSDGTNEVSDRVELTVKVENNAPVAGVQTPVNADEDQAAPVQLDGSASSDPDRNQTLTYLWTQDDDGSPRVTLNDQDQAIANFVPPNLVGEQVYNFTLTVSDGDLSDNAKVAVTVSADDDAPTAVAQDVIAAPEMNVVLDASKSTDPEGQMLSYRWRQTSSHMLGLADEITGPLVNFVAPKSIDEEEITFELIVNDGAQDSLPRTVKVSVSSADAMPPNVVVKAPMNPREDELVTVDGSESSDDFGIVTYKWTRLSGPVIGLGVDVSDNAASLDFTAPKLSQNTELTLRLTATDNSGQESFSDITFTILADDHPPIASPTAPPTSIAGVLVGLSGSGSSEPEIDDSIVSYLWEQVGPGTRVEILDADNAEASFLAPNTVTGETLSFSLVVTDQGGNPSAIEQVSIAIDSGDKGAPVADAGPDQTVGEGQVVTLDGSGSVDDFGIAKFAWRQVSGPSVMLSDTSAEKPSFTSSQLSATADIVFALEVEDNSGQKSAIEDTVTVTVNATNALPTAVAKAQMNAQASQQVSLVGGDSFDSESDDEIVSYLWTSEGHGLVITNADQATASFVAPVLKLDTSFTFGLVVTDKQGGQSEKQTVEVLVLSGDRPPVVDAGENQEVNEGTTVKLMGTAIDEFAIDSVSWRWVPDNSVPAITIQPGANPGEADVQIPNILAPIDLFFEFTAIDDSGQQSTDTVVVRVVADNDAPIVMASRMPSGDIKRGEVVNLSATVQDPEGQAIDDLQWRVKSPNNSGVTWEGNRKNLNTSARIPLNVSAATIVFELVATDAGNVKGRGSAEVSIDLTKLDQTIAFREAIDGKTLAKFIGDDKEFTEAATSSGAGTNKAIVYESSDTAIATVDNSGKVTLVARKPGKITITAKKDGNAVYKDVTASYDLDVIRFGGRTVVVPFLPHDVAPDKFDKYEGRNTDMKDFDSEAPLQVIGDTVYAKITNISKDWVIAGFDTNNPSVRVEMIEEFYLSSIDPSYDFNHWQIQNGKLYVLSELMSGSTEIDLFDISNSGSLSRTATSMDMSVTSPYRMQVLDNTIFVFSAESGMENGTDLFNTNDLSASKIHSDTNIYGLGGVVSNDNFLSVRYGSPNYLDVFDASNYSDIQSVDSIVVDDGINDVSWTDNDYAYLTAFDFFEVVDIKDNNFQSVHKLFSPIGEVGEFLGNDGDRAYFSLFNWVVEYDFSDIKNPFIASFHDFPGNIISLAFSERYAHFAVEHATVGEFEDEDELWVLNMEDKIKFVEKYDQANYGETLVYQVIWDSHVDITKDVKCWVAAGSCEVEDINFSTRSAVVKWLLPFTDTSADKDQYEIHISAGSRAKYTVARDRVKLTP